MKHSVRELDASGSEGIAKVEAQLDKLRKLEGGIDELNELAAFAAKRAAEIAAKVAAKRAAEIAKRAAEVAKSTADIAAELERIELATEIEAIGAFRAERTERAYRAYRMGLAAEHAAAARWDAELGGFDDDIPF